ncbi:MAG: phytoene desaturase family protein [Rhizomicrobium sp.]
MRYDACVIGAGADGLAAATMLARAGLTVVVIDRGDRPGGQCALREFHPGFRAAPFGDCMPAIPASIFRALNLAKLGLMSAAPQPSLALWPGREHWICPHRPSAARRLRQETAQRIAAARSRAERDVEPRSRRPLFAASESRVPWLGEDLCTEALTARVSQIEGPDAAAHLMGATLEGRAEDPRLRGSALQLLARSAPALILPGMAEALAAAAREAGVELRLGGEAAEIRQAKGRVTALALADGSEIEARAVLSTFDLKRTFLTLFSWDALPAAVVERVKAFRTAGATARLLLALDRLPSVSPETLRAAIHVAPDMQALADSATAWRAHVVPENPAMTLRVVSAVSPGLAPPGKAVLTATLGCIPFRLFDGAWTNSHRERLRDATLAAIERVIPGTREATLAAELIVPSDIEDDLGATEGDLLGGELASDQMFDMRPGFDTPAPRTPIKGLYLAGPSTPMGPLATCASGVIAAQAVIADLKGGNLG